MLATVIVVLLAKRVHKLSKTLFTTSCFMNTNGEWVRPFSAKNTSLDGQRII
jgi:hypothetical protein